MDQVPVGGEAVFARVLAHGRYSDAVPESDAAQSERRKEVSSHELSIAMSTCPLLQHWAFNAEARRTAEERREKYFLSFSVFLRALCASALKRSTLLSFVGREERCQPKSGRPDLLKNNHCCDIIGSR